jgi:hypothetical protein
MGIGDDVEHLGMLLLPLLRESQSPIGTGIVHHEDFARLPPFREEPTDFVEGRPKAFFFVISGDDNGQTKMGLFGS